MAPTALLWLVSQGRPFQAALEDLALGGEDDPVVRAALAALPQQLADQVCLERRRQV